MPHFATSPQGGARLTCRLVKGKSRKAEVAFLRFPVSPVQRKQVTDVVWPTWPFSSLLLQQRGPHPRKPPSLVLASVQGTTTPGASHAQRRPTLNDVFLTCYNVASHSESSRGNALFPSRTSPSLRVCSENTVVGFTSLPERPAPAAEGSVHAQMLISNPALTSSNKLFVKTSSYFPKQTLLRFSGLFSFQSIRCHSPMQLSRPIWIYRSQFSLKPYKAGIGLNVSPGSKTQ